MKKLMVAAACAAMAGASFAGACDDLVGADELEGCLVYDVKFSMKTLGPKKLTCKGCSKCDDATTVAYLDNATRKIEGYVWFCANDCWTKDDTPFIVLWEKKSKSIFAPLQYDANLYAEKRIKRMVDGQDTVEFSFLGRYGKKASKIAASWALEDLAGQKLVKKEWKDADTFSFIAAGVNGKGMKVDSECDEGKALMLKSISGNAAGTFDLASLATTVDCEDEEIAALYVDLCECFTSYCDECTSVMELDDVVPATGTWSLKYNSKLSKGARSMFAIVPAWAQMAE